MRRRIIREAIHELGEDTKFIRLATVTMFIHSLMFTFLIIWYARYFVSARVIDEIVEVGFALFNSAGALLVPILIVSLIVAVGYWMLPPIGEAAMIIYREEGRNQGTASLSKGTSKFFPMFEFHAATGLLQFHVVLFALFRMIGEGVLDSAIMITIIIIWTILAIFVSIFFSYSKILITLEDMSFFDAMKKSASLATHHLGITTQFTVITFLLSIRFVINIGILIGVPLLMIYLGSRLGLGSYLFFQVVFFISIALLILLVTYIEGIIEAFFITCWRKVRRVITGKETTVGAQSPIVVDQDVSGLTAEYQD